MKHGVDVAPFGEFGGPQAAEAKVQVVIGAGPR